MKKSLLILPSRINEEHIREIVQQGDDILAMTPLAMLSVESAGHRFKAIEDFYPVGDFRKNLLNINKKTESFFRELDRCYIRETGYGQVFSSNIYWFLCFFADLLVFEKIKNDIGQRYGTVRMIVNERLPKIDWSELSYDELKLLQQVSGLNRKITFLNSIINPELIFINQKEDEIELPLGNKISGFVVRNKHRIRQKLVSLNSILRGMMAFDSRKTVFVAQGGSEIRQLMFRIGVFRMVNPVAIAEKAIQNIAPKEIRSFVGRNIFDDFIVRNFRSIQPFISGLFSAYIHEVIGRLADVRSLFDSLLQKYDPAVVLFATCAHQPFEGLLASMANARNIPVVYFQHGGAMVFVNHIYQKYLERNSAIKKTLVLDSQMELTQASHEGSECKVFGSIRLYQFRKDMATGKSNSGKAIYCCGPFPYSTYKELFASVSDAQCYQVNRDILEGAKAVGLNLDIKLHPTEQSLNYAYFEQLLKTIDYAQGRVVYGVPVELIMKKYGLIIMEYLPSAVLPYALVIGRPVLLYLRDKSLMNPIVRADMEERCYIVTNRQELNNILKKFASGDLPSKWSSRIVDQYAYPMDKGDPEHAIAAYLKGLMKRPGNSTAFIRNHL